MKKHKVGIVGLGFVGTACEIGFQNIAEIKSYDKYKPSESLEEVVNSSDIIFVAVPTPTNFDTGECDTSIVEDVCKEICNLAEKSKCIVIKSTIPPGTTDKIQSKCSGHIVVFNPEFLTEKNFIDDFKNQDRIILGHSFNVKLHPLESPSYKKLIVLYQDFVKKQDVYVSGMREALVVECLASEAEMLKYTTNAFLSAKVSFFNEIFQICKEANINYENVVKMLGYDDRIGTGHTKVPGPDGQFGWGRKMFSKRS